MPMRDPTTSTAFTPPSAIQSGAMFVGTLAQVETRPYSGPPRAPKFDKDGNVVPDISIVWHFTLRDHNTLEPVLGDDGESFEMWRFTGDSTGTNSSAREVIHALAGREVTNAEVSQLLASDPDHMPTRLVGKHALLILGSYKNARGESKVGIAQTLPLSASDRARVQAHVGNVARAEATEPRIGPPTQQFDQNGTEVKPQPQPASAGATADGSPELPW